MNFTDDELRALYVAMYRHIFDGVPERVMEMDRQLDPDAELSAMGKLCDERRARGLA